MQNYFVGCGGTGAHVILAMVRLHILGYPFGFFKGGSSKNFPDFFLIDKDSGNKLSTDGKTTAWEEVTNLLGQHPGRFEPKSAFGLTHIPKQFIVSPLPVGPDGNWSKINDTLGEKFGASPVLDLVTTKKQQDKIHYSLGMMASPAVGSLLFSLKKYDRPYGKPNNDQEYNALINKCGKNPVVVCGSIVGGTGASVTPTISRQLRKEGADVMAVLIHRWFEFDENDDSKNNYKDSVKRNREMKENAASGLASVGESLAIDLPTVLVGAPSKGLTERKYTGDNQQSHKDSYIHVVAALAAMKHLLSNTQSSGLYGISASSDHELTGDIQLGNSVNSTLNKLLDQAWLLSEFLGIYCGMLEEFEDPSKNSKIAKRLANRINFGRSNTPQLEIYEWIFNAAGSSTIKVGSVSKKLKDIKKNYDEILKWLSGLTPGYQPIPTDNKWQLAVFHSQRLKVKPLPTVSIDNSSNTIAGEEYIALSLYHWITEWVSDYYNDIGGNPPPIRGKANLGYWPTALKKGLSPAFDTPGILKGFQSPSNISQCLQNYYNLKEISSNGWPDAFAVTEVFKFLINSNVPDAIRKFEILLVGRMLGYLQLEPVKFIEEKKRDRVSIETLIEKEGNDLGRFSLRLNKNRLIYGFSSPYTLLCPAPDRNDDDWNFLWQEITNYVDPYANWKTSQDWGSAGSEAIRRVDLWIQRLIQHRPMDNALIWATKLSKKFPNNDHSFGIAEWLQLSDGTKIPLPIKGYSISPPKNIIANESSYDAERQEKEILDLIPEFNKWEKFHRIEKIFLPGLSFPISMIWKEHLDGLQADGQFFSWGTHEGKDQIWIMMDLEPKVIHIKNLRVIDIDKIQITNCVPLKQNPVPGSKLKENTIKFPDLPLLPEYTTLAIVPPGNVGDGEALVDHNWRGLSNCVPDQKNGTVKWKVHLMGRSGEEEIEIDLDPNITPAAAHWIIWPNFKSPKDDKTPWRAYYVYEDSSRKSLEAQVLTQNDDRSISEPKKRPLSILGPSRSVEYKQGKHTGGAPIALCAYDEELGEYVGLYKIELHEFAVHNNNTPWKLALDFGTSHTVAARREEKGNVHVDTTIEIESELTSKRKGMSLHISENWPGKSSIDPNDQRRKEFLEVWRPTYVDSGLKPMLRSDLWSLQKDDFGKIQNVKQNWEPMTHYAIPSWDLDSEIRKHIISGFKWEMHDENFHGTESWLQEIYLGMAIEIFVAEIIRDRQEFPNEIQFTFTYPLRGTSDGSTDRYKAVISEKVFPNCEASLGCTLDITQGLSLFSESHAAAGGVGTGNPYEVKLVADLGGGTLDIFISTTDKDPANSRFKKQVADSAKLGANLLLAILARGRDVYLPQGTEWKNNFETAYLNLCAWMRSKGSPKLFNFAGRELSSLNLKGFKDKRSANKSRILIDRYFRLIVDFMTRNLVAYVVGDVLDKLNIEEINELKLIVQLQGNGWRLWYGSENYNEIHQQMLHWIIERSNQLWTEIDQSDTDFSNRKDLWDDEDQNLGFDPKTGPICNAVGESMNPDEVELHCFKFPLSRVILHTKEGGPTDRKWYDRLPFENISEGSSLRIKEFDPPLCIHSLTNSDKSIAKIENKLIKKINEEISNPTLPSSGKIEAPIAALIWEQILDSSEFQKFS